MRSISILLGGTALAIVAAMPVVAAAQGQAMAAPTAPVATAQVEEVVVTARRRAESLQSVPVSATVVGGQSIAERNISTVQDLTLTLPSVQLAKGSTANRQFIRGIGSGDNPSFEQSVGAFVDDVYHGRSRTSEGDLFDLDRVEVLKGPQSTYFGNNAIAGALNIATRDPGPVFGGFGRVAYNPTFAGYAAEGAVNLPVSDTFAIRLAGQLQHSDGWIDEAATGGRVPDTHDAAIRATALWKPTDALTVRLKVQHTSENETGGLPLVRSGCPQPAAYGGGAGFCAAVIAAGATPFSGDFDRHTSAGQSTHLRSDDQNLNIAYDAGPVTLTSVTAFSRYGYRLNQDLDFSPLNLLSLQAPEHYRQFSQEFRLTSNGDGPIQYLAGAYYQHSHLDVQNLITYGFLSPTIAAAPPFAPLIPYLPLATDDRFQETADTGSVFGSVTWKATDRIQFTGALRYTEVKKDFDQLVAVDTGNFTYAPAQALPAALVPLAAAFAHAGGLATVGENILSRRDDHLSGSASVQFQATDSVMLYGRYDNGFKAGGFNGVDLTDGPADLAFAPETVNAFEAGAKMRLFDDRAVLNIALFHADYSDLQLAGVVPSVSGAYVNRVQNAGGALSQGVEVEGDFRITPTLRTSLAATWLDSHYTSYPNATPTALQSLAGLKVQDLTGARTPFAPRIAVNWTTSYEAPLANGLRLRLANTLFYKTRQYLNFNNDSGSTQGAYAREDVTVAVASDHGWEVSVIGKNLTDHVIRTYGAAYPTSLGSFLYITEPPRNVTVQLRYDF